MRKGPMNILLATNDSWAEYVIVLLNSLYTNHPDMEVDTYILYLDLDPVKLRMIEGFSGSKGQRVFFVSMKPYEKILTQWGEAVSERVGREAFCRLLAHESLPKSMERCLYLDIDVIINKNIREFYDLDFHGNYLIAAAHAINYEAENSTPKDKKKALKGGYFNSGVLVINLRKFRESITVDNYLETFRELGRIYDDQRLLNYMFCNKTRYESSVLYNFKFAHVHSKESRKRIQEFYHVDEAEIIGMAAIIHYNNYIAFGKPWDLCFDAEESRKYALPVLAEAKDSYVINDDQQYLARIWWKYAKETPVYDSLRYQMLIKKEWYKRQISDIMRKLYRYYGTAKKLEQSRTLLRKLLLISYVEHLRSSFQAEWEPVYDTKAYRYVFLPVSEDRKLHYEFQFTEEDDVRICLHFEGRWKKHRNIIDPEQLRMDRVEMDTGRAHEICYLWHSIEDIGTVVRLMHCLIVKTMPVLQGQFSVQKK